MVAVTQFQVTLDLGLDLELDNICIKTWDGGELEIQQVVWTNLWSMGGRSFSVSSHIPGGKVKVSLP